MEFNDTHPLNGFYHVGCCCAFVWIAQMLALNWTLSKHPKVWKDIERRGAEKGFSFRPKTIKLLRRKTAEQICGNQKGFFCLVAMLMESRHAKYMWWLDWEKGKVVPEIYWNFPIKCTFMSKWHSKTGSHITTSNNSEHDILDRHEISFYFLLCLSVFQILPSKLGIQHSRCV